MSLLPVEVNINPSSYLLGGSLVLRPCMGESKGTSCCSATFLLYANTFSHSESDQKISTVSMVAVTKLLAFPRSILVLCRRSDSPFEHVSNLSKITNNKINLNDFTCNKRPLASAALLPSPSSVIFIKVEATASNV